MMPSIELRLKTMAKSMQEVILPAIAPGNDLAREQAQLLIAHLGLIGRQWQHAHAYDALILRGITALAETLVAATEGGPRTLAAAAAVTECLNACASATGTPAAKRAAIADVIDQLVSASAIDGSDGFRKRLFDAIVDHAALQGWRDRVWFADSGMDPERAALPDIEHMLAS